MNLACDRQVALSQPQAVQAVTLRIWRAVTPRRPSALLLGHGAGSALDERVLTTVCAGLAARGVTCATFNFPYRQAGRRIPDRADRLQRAFVDVLSAFADDGDAGVLVVGGRSMGGRIASLVAADGRGDGILALGYPLWPGGRRPADGRRTAHWPRITTPVLFVHGDRDRLCPVDELDRARHAHLSAPHRAHVVAGADHGFAVRARDRRTQREVDTEIVEAIARWVRDTVEERRHG